MTKSAKDLTLPQASEVMIRTESATAKSYGTKSRVRLQPAAFNLIMNAIKGLFSTSMQHRILTVRSKPLQGSVEVELKDSGARLREHAADRMAEPFYTIKENGIGMGLALWRPIIESQGGILSSRAYSPYGAVFSFTVPERKSKASTELSATHG